MPELSISPIDCGLEWIALVDRETHEELTPRQRYAEDKELVFNVVKGGVAYMGWFAEEHGGKPMVLVDLGPASHGDAVRTVL